MTRLDLTFGNYDATKTFKAKYSSLKLKCVERPVFTNWIFAKEMALNVFVGRCAQRLLASWDRMLIFDCALSPTPSSSFEGTLSWLGSTKLPRALTGLNKPTSEHLKQRSSSARRVGSTPARWRTTWPLQGWVPLKCFLPTCVFWNGVGIFGANFFLTKQRAIYLKLPGKQHDIVIACEGHQEHHHLEATLFPLMTITPQQLAALC